MLCKTPDYDLTDHEIVVFEGRKKLGRLFAI